jgi:hypothetical protein
MLLYFFTHFLNGFCLSCWEHTQIYIYVCVCVCVCVCGASMLLLCTGFDLWVVLKLILVDILTGKLVYVIELWWRFCYTEMGFDSSHSTLWCFTQLPLFLTLPHGRNTWTLVSR